MRAGLLATAALTLTVSLSCGSARRSEPLTGEHRFTDPEVILGERVFSDMCQQCHPRGQAGLGFALNNKPMPGWLIRFQVRNGLGAMPALPEEAISDEELDAVVAYLKELRGLES